MADLVLTAEIQNKATELIENALIKAGVSAVLLIDGAGNVLANCGARGAEIDAISLAALAAASLGATAQIAKLIGEEDFSLLFHKGKTGNIHFGRLGNDLILVTIFTDEVSLGLVRCRVTEITQPILDIFEA